jgi:carbonic anhydrase/acetyltransferase-like protein (isoleucine patch superfamily)
VPLYELDGAAPRLPEGGSAWIAPGAMLIGQVTLGPGVSVWFNAVLRGDNEPITIGRDSNVQDGCVFHTDPGFPLTIGADVTVGHKAILHGCTVGDGCLIGMGAVVMNGARIGANCLLAANALVTEGKEIPDGSLVVGQPARVARALDEATIRTIREASARYRARQDQYRAGLRRVGEDRD